MRDACARAVVLAAAIALGGCRGSGAVPCEGAAADAAVVDTALVAFLSIARALHHEADIAESRGDPSAAIAALERLVAAPSPPAVEADEVRADARARLAELRIKRGDLDRAAADVRDGLDRLHGPTYFRGHLLEVSGLVEEARASALADAGDADGAARARASAVRLFEDAVRVQQIVIERALSDGGSEGDE
jgi:tetratricopeptide (TPR) repeat protein